MRVSLYALVAARVLMAMGIHFFVPLLTLYPVENLALTYDAASMMLGAYGLVAALTALAASPALDRLPALTVSLCASVATATARLAAVFLLPPAAAVLTLCVLVPALDAIASLPMLLAMKRLLKVQLMDDDAVTRQLQWFNALTYALGNAADVVANLSYDALRQALGPRDANTTAMALAALSILAAAAPLVLARLRVKAADRGVVTSDVTMGAAPCATTCRDRRLHKFMGVSTLLLGVRMIFRHLDSTLIVYLLRVPPAVGGVAAQHFALIQAINPALILVLTPVAGYVLRNVEIYTCLVGGTLLSGISPLLLGWALASRDGGAAAVLGGAIAFITLFSIGESIFSPQFDTYAMKVAPEGTEAMFASFASIPTLVAKIPSSILSALLMDTYCPAPASAGAALAACDGASLWLWIGLAAMTTPLGLSGLHTWLRQ